MVHVRFDCPELSSVVGMIAAPSPSAIHNQH
jgi:hypothetical protein